MKRNVLSVAVLIPCPLAARCRCQVTGCASSLRSSYLSRWGALLPRPLVVSPVSALRKREGFGGEKAAISAASLPVPNIPNFSHTPGKLSRLRQCSASGKSEQKREVAFPQKSGKTTSRYCGSSSLCRPTALPHCTASYPAPFILATTEPHKIPATIISRCQRMDFHRLGVSDMVRRTEEVLERENAHIERDGLMAIARAAEGGMRDCLSLADQCLSFCGNNVSTQDVYSVLGSMEDGFLFDMAEAVLSSDPARALELLDQVVRDGRDLKVFLHDLTQHMRSLLLTKLCGHCSDILDCTEDSMKRYEEQAKEAGETRLLRCSELLLQAEGRLRTVTMPRALIESTLVRISRPEEKRTMDDLMERIEVLERQVREGAPRRTAIAEPIPIGEKPDADEYPCDYGFEEPPEPEDVPPFDIDEPIRTAPASKPEKPSPAHPAKPAETAGSMSPQKLWKAILDKLGETERTMAVSGMYGKGSAINGNVLEVAFESEIIYRMMSAPGALEKVNGAADKVAPGYTVRMTHSSGGDDIESTGRALFGSNFRIEN